MAISSYKWLLSRCLFPGILVFTVNSPVQRVQPVQWGTPNATETGSPAGSSVVTQAGHATEVFHPFYVSVTEINHNVKDKILEISCKLFTSDLEAVLEKNLHTKVDLSSPTDKKTSDGYIAAYVTKNLQIKVDGKPVALQFVGSEKEQDASWCYFQVNNVAAVKKIDITNSLLYDGFDKEINIMHVSVGGDRKSGKVEYPETGISFSW